MRKGLIPTVSIDSDQIRKEIKATGYSIRSLASEIGVDRRTIMNALKAGEMQEYLFALIMNKIQPKQKSIWMRLGVTVPVSEDELFEIMEYCYMHDDMYYHAFSDYSMDEGEAAKLLKRAIADGESYIPECCFDEHLDWWLKERERRGLK